MTRTWLWATMALLLAAAYGPRPAAACNDLYPDLCRPIATAPAAEQPQAKRSRAYRSRAAHVRKGVSSSRRASRRQAERSRAAERRAERRARRYAGRMRRSIPNTESEERASDTQLRATPVRPLTAAAPPSAGQKRFRAFIDPTPLTHNGIEAWRGPRLDANLFEPASTLAETLADASDAERGADDSGVASIASARALEADVVASHSAIVSEPPPEQKVEAPVVRVSSQTVRAAEETSSLFSLRGLMLALGGAATLASALRLMIGV